MMLIRNIIKPIFPKAYYPYNKLILEYLKSIALLSDDKIYTSLSIQFKFYQKELIISVKQ